MQLASRCRRPNPRSILIGVDDQGIGIKESAAINSGGGCRGSITRSVADDKERGRGGTDCFQFGVGSGRPDTDVAALINSEQFRSVCSSTVMGYYKSCRTGVIVGVYIEIQAVIAVDIPMCGSSASQIHLPHPDV